MVEGERRLLPPENVMSNMNSISLIDTYMVKPMQLTDLYLLFLFDLQRY
jgi:hypothetical protein